MVRRCVAGLRLDDCRGMSVQQRRGKSWRGMGKAAWEGALAGSIRQVKAWVHEGACSHRSAAVWHL